MFSKIFRILPACLRRRYVSSVVTEENITDFCVENEPVRKYKDGSSDMKKLQEAMSELLKEETKIPIMIGEREITEGEVYAQLVPHDHSKVLARVYQADEYYVNLAMQSAEKMRQKWQQVSWEERFKIWRKAGDLIAKKYRYQLNAATILGQSKTVAEAEEDSACELADFMRFNAYFAKEAIKYQPLSPSPKKEKNSIVYRGLEGVVAAISPFNSTAAAGNMAYTPALMGNVVVWKPSNNAALSNYLIYKIMLEAGLPPGVVNFVPSVGITFGTGVICAPELAAINFTGSDQTFCKILKKVSDKINSYKVFPRVLGECGGKNFHLIHPSADVQSALAHTIRAAFEYCGQKCSACSRLFVPSSLWKGVRCALIETASKFKVGDPADCATYMGAVIDVEAFSRINDFIDQAKEDMKTSVIYGGESTNDKGFFIEPTIVQCRAMDTVSMTQEVLGPVLSVFVYKDSEINEVIHNINLSSSYALTGAIFATDECFLREVLKELSYSAGNLYINDKCTGAIVGQNPYGGLKRSGTNDKPGGKHYVLRFSSIQSIKESFEPAAEIC